MGLLFNSVICAATYTIYCTPAEHRAPLSLQFLLIVFIPMPAEYPGPRFCQYSLCLLWYSPSIRVVFFPACRVYISWLLRLLNSHYDMIHIDKSYRLCLCLYSFKHYYYLVMGNVPQPNRPTVALLSLELRYQFSSSPELSHFLEAACFPNSAHLIRWGVAASSSQNLHASLLTRGI